MKKFDRHYTEEELLLHVLGEEAAEISLAVTKHLRECEACHALCQDYRSLVGKIAAWRVPDLPEEEWHATTAALRNVFLDATARRRDLGLLRLTGRRIQMLWDFALENPLPTVGYLVLALAFASERTFTIFRMDRVLPAASDLVRLFSQLFWG